MRASFDVSFGSTNSFGGFGVLSGSDLAVDVSLLLVLSVYVPL